MSAAFPTVRACPRGDDDVPRLRREAAIPGYARGDCTAARQRSLEREPWRYCLGPVQRHPSGRGRRVRIRDVSLLASPLSGNGRMGADTERTQSPAGLLRLQRGRSEDRARAVQRDERSAEG